jgi:hypothetical protein
MDRRSHCSGSSQVAPLKKKSAAFGERTVRERNDDGGFMQGVARILENGKSETL